MTTYVIRENCFFYDDCYDAYVGSKIAYYFTDRVVAEAEYKRLEIEAVSFVCLWNQETLWNAQEAFEPELRFLKELDAFVLSCCGQHILEDGRVKIKLPKNMQDDDIFEFVQRAGIQKYEIFEFEEESIFYAIWINREQHWFIKERESSAYLAYEQSVEKLLESLQDGYFNSFSEEDFIYQGTLDEMSETPMLLRNILANLEWVKYDEVQQCLTISSYDVSAILQLNSLLKPPIFEVKALSLQQVLEIEQKIAEKQQQEYDVWEAEYRAELAKNNPPSAI